MTWGEHDRLTRRVARGARSSHVHLRTLRDDGYVSAQCVRHVKTPPTQTQAGDLVITRDRSAVTCPMCLAVEAS